MFTLNLYDIVPIPVVVPTIIKMPRLFDAHTHLRDHDGPDCLLSGLVRHSSRYCDAVVAMPNVNPPLTDADLISRYRDAVVQASHSCNHNMTVYLTAKLNTKTTTADVAIAKMLGIVGYKLYPDGVTTNSNDGVPRTWLRDIGLMADILKAMRDQGLVLLCHGEMPGEECLDRERLFLPFIEMVVTTFPDLRVVMEHITCAEAVQLVRYLNKNGYHNVAATITGHHLLCTHDDVLIGSDMVGVQGNRLKPHNHCLPVPKYRRDRTALVEAATSGEAPFFLGSDNAAHPIDKKHCGDCCAGVFSMPVLVPTLVEVFERTNRLQMLPRFAAANGARFYGHSPNTSDLLTIERKAWTVPASYHIGPKQVEVVPFRAGETLDWQMADG